VKVARLILDPPCDGAWNMAVDEALLRAAADSDRITLRIYAWSRPTVSLGYFQALADRASHAASRDCSVVRRASGGGAIVHDRELTYSLTAPVQDRIDRQLSLWYDWVHEAWTVSLRELGIEADRCADTDRLRERLFLCFQRRAAGDLLLKEYKIGGSAQRRHQHAALQHGSLLLARSAAAPELPGIRELADRPWSDSSWRETWLETLARRMGVTWDPGSLTDQEVTWADALVRDKFGNPTWTCRR
jgi:lipoate-protein ligase A